MAKRVIILDRVKDAPGVSFRYLLWAAAPTARQAFYANPAATTAYKNASAQELSDIQAGAVVEVGGTAQWPAGTPLAAIRADLQARWTAVQAEVNGTNYWDFYGTSWDGTSWTVAGVA